MSSYDPYPPPRPPRTAYLIPVLLALLLVEVGAVAAWYYWSRGSGPARDPDAAPRAVTPRGDLAQDEQATIELYKKSRPSVVNVTTVGLRRNAYSLNVQEVPEGTGSGFIWDDKGHVVTNFHVVQNVLRNPNGVKVTLADHTLWDAKVIGALPDKDLAVLYISAPKDKLVPIPVGKSEDLQVGQKAFAIGNPFGLDQTLTTGIVSALDREIQSVNDRPIRSVIQTNAAINPGNSGGPLLDSAGRLIGVNTAILSPSGASAGIGFAIPVDEVNRVVPELIKHGKVLRPGLGVQVASDQVAQQAGVDGVLIARVVPGGAADQAGLRGVRPAGRDEDDVVLGDVLVSVDGKPVKNRKDMFNALEGHKIGDTVTVTILREGERQDVKVTLQAID